MSQNITVDRPEFQEEIIDLRHYWRVLMQHKWSIAAFSIMVSVVSILVVFSLKPIYQATTTVLIENQQTKILSIEDVYGINTTNKEYFLTQFEILKSRDLAERVIRRLKLDRHPSFAPPQQESGVGVWAFLGVDDEPSVTDQSDSFDAVVAKFINNLVISPVRKTQLVKIHYASEDPKLAALIANTLADVYIESHLEAKLGVTKKAADWLGDRLGDLRTTVQISEKRLQAYRDDFQLVDLEGVQTLDAEELEQITRRYVDAKNMRSQAQTVYEQIKALGNDPEFDKLMAIPSILRNDLVQALKREEVAASRYVAELSQRYGPKHPKMIAAQLSADSALKALRTQVVGVAESITADYNAARSTEISLERQLDQSKQRLQSVNRQEFKLRELEREVETNRHLYDMFLQRSKETDHAEGLQAAHARIIDPAVAPRLPVKPKKKLIVILAAVASAMFAAALVLLRDALNNTVRTPDDVEEKLHASLLGFLPLVKHNKSDMAYEGFLSDSKSSFSESVRTIRTGLMLSAIDEPHKITIVTSSVPNEGKSTVALNLAEAVGQMEKVLLIDGDMRKPVLGRTLGLSRTAPGLSNLVAGTADFRECVQKLPGTTVDVLASGVIPGNPLELLSSKRFSTVLQKLRQHYDRIIIDSAPTHAVSDSMVLSTFADAVVYVVKADATAAPLAAKGIKRLRGIAAPVTGVVLNMVDIEKSSSYDAYYADYYRGYGYTLAPEQSNMTEKVA